MAKRLAFASLALCLGLGLALGLGEGLVRLLVPRTLAGGRGVDGPFVPGMTPGEAGETVLIEGGRTSTIPYRINGLGFRDRERTPRPAPGSARVAVLGDSFVAGFAVAEDEIFPRVAERELDRPGRPTEVLACGVSGYGTGLELITLEEKVLPLEPTQVILAFFQNDPWDNSRRLSAARVPFFSLDPVRGVVRDESAVPTGRATRGLSRWLNEHSRLYRFQKEKVQALEIWFKARARQGIEALPKPYHPLAQPMIPHLAEAWDLTLALVDRMALVCRERRVGFAVVDIPIAEAISPSRLAYSRAKFPAMATVDFEWRRSLRILGSHCSARAIPYLDLAEGLAAGGDPADCYLADDGHLTVEGHRRVGAALARFLEGLTPPRGGS